MPTPTIGVVGDLPTTVQREGPVSGKQILPSKKKELKGKTVNKQINLFLIS
ncbi:MAG TPA: hypothetical protein VL242_03990 [Sorangium sp.]|nr:hypothetical protein [Sorangium sp.]